MYASKVDKYVQSASSHGVVFFQEGNLWLLPVTGTRRLQPRPLLTTEDTELFGEISPDGHWLLYESNLGGKNNVYVTSFPSLSGRWPVSEDGGILPKWSVNGREIFYLSQDHSALFASAVRPQGTVFDTPSSQRLFFAPMVAGRGYPYDVSADGQQFLVVTSATTTPITVILNWPSEVKP